MKRIYNDIPLQSVMYFIPGNVLLTIRDMKSGDVLFNKDAEPLDTLEISAKDSSRIPERYKYAKVYHMEAPEANHIVFHISTQLERY